jgi:hypothetical protein
MKTQLLTLLSIAALLTAISCNEKVSSEVDGAGSSTTGGTDGSTSGGTSGGTTTGTSTDGYTEAPFFFRIKEETSELFGYQLHRTGFHFDVDSGTYLSNRQKKCEITDTTAFSALKYDTDALITNHDDKQYDITCFMEAEELSLYLAGMKFKVEAGPKSCSSIAFSPFSYFSYMPGDSTTAYRKVTCPDGETTGVPGPDLNGMDCGDYRNGDNGMEYFGTNIPTPVSDTDLCRFNYTSENGPNCDIGKITIYNYNYEYIDSSDPTAGIQPATPAYTTSVVNCGGKITSCLSGSIKKVTPSVNVDASSWIQYTSPTDINSILSQTYTFPPLIDEHKPQYGNIKYVNFRRELAAKETDYENKFDSPATYFDAFDGTTYAPPKENYELSFDPIIMSLYSRNKLMSGMINLDSAEITNAFAADFYQSTPYASEPYLSTNSNFPTQPFYAFYCYDSSQELRARIRVVVREWDMQYPDQETDDSFDFISDLFKPFPYQDNSSNDPNGDQYDDLPDWSWFTFVDRTPGPWNTASTEFTPVTFDGASTIQNFQKDSFPKDLATDP